MDGYKKILVPIDGSKNSFHALSHAVAIARSFDAEISILYISVLSQQYPFYDQIQGSKIPAKALTDPKKFAEQIIAEALKQVPEGIRVQTHNEIGEPRIAITEFAEQNGYDIIVIGSRGLGTISGLLLGSVSSYVVRNAKCAVLVAK
ncbi:universal stress protein [Sporomusaceae bacterium FL31]|nr:Universal stress protein [Sporomusaceae bacterium FL31]GCE33715.1 universal stress protein [Sporomusaceae bacterium]